MQHQYTYLLRIYLRQENEQMQAHHRKTGKHDKQVPRISTV